MPYNTLRGIPLILSRYSNPASSALTLLTVPCKAYNCS